MPRNIVFVLMYHRHEFLEIILLFLIAYTAHRKWFKAFNIYSNDLYATLLCADLLFFCIMRCFKINDEIR
jgi:hypothetical protein